MPNDNPKGGVSSPLFGIFLECGGVTEAQFIIQIILARLLPADYGIITLIVDFIAISRQTRNRPRPEEGD